MYESWFRFRRRPFAAAPRVDDYYPAESAEAARKSLIACVQRGAGPGLLIGSAGSGKSTLCHQLLSHFRTRTSVALVSCSGLAARRALFQNILFELGRPYRDLDEGELRLSLVDYLTSRDASQAGTVLLFDDAHHLNVELFDDLRMLSSMVRDGHWCVHIVMSGNLQLEEILSVPHLESFNQRIAARCYLEPFRSDETAAYVRRQFERVAGNADNVFIANALTAIHECSSGTPRLINQLCDHALLLAATGSRTQLDEHGIREAWSDLQHLPPPEKDSEAQTSVDEIVEFGSLDQEQTSAHADTSAAVAVTTRAEGTECDHEPQHLLCHPSPQESSPAEAAIARTNDSSRLAAELKVDTDVQFYDAESFDSESVVADRVAVEPMDADQIDVDKSFDTIEAHLNRYDDTRPPQTENPFLEDFVEEEVIVDRPSSLLNRVVTCQPPVTSRYGQELQSALDRFSLATVMGQPWPLASDTASPRASALPVDSVDNAVNRDDNGVHGNSVADAAVAENVCSDTNEYAGRVDETTMDETAAGAAAVEDNAADDIAADDATLDDATLDDGALDGATADEATAAADAALEHSVDFADPPAAVPDVAIAEVAIPEVMIPEANPAAPVPEVTVGDVAEAAVVEDTVGEESVVECAAIEASVAEDALADEAIADDTFADEAVADDAVADDTFANDAVADDAVADDAVAGDAVADDAVADEAVTEDAVTQDPVVEDVVVEDAVVQENFVEDAVVSEKAAIEVTVADDIPREAAACDEVVFEHIVTETASEVAVPADDPFDAFAAESADQLLPGSSAGLPVPDSIDIEFEAKQADASASELDATIDDGQQDEAVIGLDEYDLVVDIEDAIDASSADGSPEKLTTPPAAENGEVIEVFEVELSEHAAGTRSEFVARRDTEPLSEPASKSSLQEDHSSGEAPQEDRELLPRNAKPGRRLNRLFSNLADR